MSELFTEWPLDADGIPHRQAARVVLFTETGETLMLLGHDIDDVDHRWWFTPGGGCEAGESAVEAALREISEETGLVLGPERLIGPVLYRQSTFRFAAKTRKQDEHFFVAQITAAERDIIDRGGAETLTELEKNVIDDRRWWQLDELERAELVGETVYPIGFVERARSWLRGWDGTCQHVVED